MSYPLTSVVEKILDAAYSGNTDIEVAAGKFAEEQSSATKRFAVFSYLRDFEFLWGLHRDGGVKETVENVITASYKQNPSNTDEYISNELTLIVVWDGMPESDGTPMNVGGYVTPFDWAVMFSCCLFRSANDPLNKDKPKPKVRILILDLKSHEYGTSFGIKAFQALHGQFPWIQVYRPVGKQRDKFAAFTEGDEFAHTRAALPLDVFGFWHFIKDVQHTDRVLFTFDVFDDADRLNDLEIAAGLWRNHLVKPGDRHTVANLIGPLILANGIGAKRKRNEIIKAITEGSPLRNALVQLVYATGLVSPIIKHGGGSGALLQADIYGRLGRRQYLKFVLVDDQFASGFHHILTSLIFETQYTPKSQPIGESWSWSMPDDKRGITCYSRVDILLNKLCECESGNITDWDMPRKLSLPDNGDILLLDLRLWLEDSQRKGFFDSLKTVCDQLDVSLLCEKDESFRRAYGAAFECGEQNETAMLVLLPLLLSYFDPSLPIVLFSSTHQRAVIEMVAHRPNIITDFSKPLLGNYAQIKEAGVFLNDLRSSLEKAIQLHEARIIWERIVILSCKAPEFYTEYKVGNKSSFRFSNQLPLNIVKNYPLNEEEARKRLGYYFQHYILRKTYFDFVSIPWEFIEGGLAEDNDLARFDVTFIKKMKKLPKNGAGLLLKKLRHKKAHGELAKLISTLDQKREEWRYLSILEFLVFIDFLEQSDHHVDSPCNRFIDLLDAAKADVDGNILKYSLDLICAIWGKVDQSFSSATKDVVKALRS